ncbi:MAG: carbon-nitrogen hydrolase [Sulfuricurvum sp. PC08-66]|nr:MAG: carbon-nitrogen hydrolase [Sulfuricurvum sp. PC08-66]
MKVAVIQLSAVGLSSDALRAYLRTCVKEGVSVVLLGEYLLNRFFKELEQTPLAMLREQSLHHIEALKNLSIEHNLTIVAPLVQIKGDKIFKTIVRFSPQRTFTYTQQLLINYRHWNEEAFFANPIAPLHEPMHFKIDKFRFAVMGGFELHFDAMWSMVDALGIDVVLLPTLSTFASHERWRNLIAMRAFTHHSYIVRANRIGEYQEPHTNVTWEFYGDSLVASPEGEIIEHLGNYEEVLIIELEKKALKEARSWGFRDAIKTRSSSQQK